MTNQDFKALAVRVMAGEANAAEIAQLERCLATDDRCRRTFTELQAAWTALRETRPLVQALDAKPQPPPESRLFTLLRQVKEHQPHRPPVEAKPAAAWLEPLLSWLRAHQVALAAGTTVLLTLGALVWIQVSRPSAPSHPTQTHLAGHLIPLTGNAQVRRGPMSFSLRQPFAALLGDELVLTATDIVQLLTGQGLTNLAGPLRLRLTDAVAPTIVPSAPQDQAERQMRTALFETPDRIRTAGLLLATRSGSPVPLYSPRTATANPTPLIWWKGRPDGKYDVTITDELQPGTPALRLRAVAPPVDFGQAWPGRALTPGGLYRVIVRESGDALAVAEHTFMTLPHRSASLSEDPPTRLVRALAQLSTDPPCVGDALVDLHALPPPWADSPLAIRLRLLAYGQLGLADDFEEAAARFEAGTNP